MKQNIQGASSLDFERIHTMTFNKTIAMAVYRQAVTTAPYDTGNLAYSIRMPISTPRFIQIHYPVRLAHYLPILEENPRNKHYKFIYRFATEDVPRMMYEYFQTGKTGFAMDLNRRQILRELSTNRGNPRTSYHSRLYVGKSRYNSDTRSKRRIRSVNIYAQRGE